jgi:GT2 family glycosyltransferase
MGLLREHESCMSEPHPRIYIVIPVHNRWDATEECLDSIDCQTYKNFQVVLVDDGSTDGTSSYVKMKYPEVVLLKGDGNLWWTGATNLGVCNSLQCARDNDYVLTLNNDTVLPATYLSTMIALSRQMPHALIGSIAFSYEEKDVVVDGGVRIHWPSAKFMSLKILHGQEKDTFYTVSALSGRGTLIPVSVFHRIGLYDARYFPHYTADYDFSLRAHKAGYVLAVHSSCYLYSKTKLTGMSNVHTKISFGAWLGSFNSIKSPYNLKVRFRFGLRHAPPFCYPSFILCDILRVIFGTFRNQIWNLIQDLSLKLS